MMAGQREYRNYPVPGLWRICVLVLCMILPLVAAAALTTEVSLRERPLYPAGTVSLWFETGNLRAGGEMLELHRYGSELLRFVGQSTPYEIYGNRGFFARLLSMEIRADRPGVLCGGQLLAVKDGMAQVSTLYGETRTYPFDLSAVMTKDGRYDYNAIYAMLTAQERKPIVVEDAAILLTLAQEGILLGYREGEAVFARDDGDMYTILYQSAETDNELTFPKDGTVPLMAAGKLLLYTQKGKAFVMDVSSLQRQTYALEQYTDGTWTDSEIIRAQNYRFEPEYGQLSLTYATDNHFFKIIYAENTVNRYSRNHTVYDAPPQGLYVSGAMAYVTLSDGSAHWFEIPVVPEFVD